ncbi:hypothetical protein ACHAPT_006151 [Fusarium lateritium]
MATTATQSQPSSHSTIKSEMAFLKRDPLWEREKPYKLGYEPADASIPRTNHKPEIHPVEVHDLRQSSLEMSLDTNGFEVHHLNSRLRYEEFFDEQKVSSVYLKELQQLVKKVCGGKQAIPLDAEASLVSLFPLQTRDKCSVWKPLEGPVEDWPLALCDARTLDPSDAIPSDVVYAKVATENYLIHYSDQQRWYYLDHQEPGEVFMFKAADSEPGKDARQYTCLICLWGSSASYMLGERLSSAKLGEVFIS